MRRVVLAVPLVSLMLGACSDLPKTWRQSEIEEIAANTAEDFADAGSANVSDELSTQINQLEQRIADLERENQSQRELIDELYSNQKRMVDYLNGP